jgi:hypothetical protein
LLRTRGKAKSERQFASTDEFVERLANEAVKDVWEHNRVKLGTMPLGGNVPGSK